MANVLIATVVTTGTKSGNSILVVTITTRGPRPVNMMTNPKKSKIVTLTMTSAATGIKGE